MGTFLQDVRSTGTFPLYRNLAKSWKDADFRRWRGKMEQMAFDLPGCGNIIGVVEPEWPE
jgi:hypothetical protein